MIIRLIILVHIQSNALGKLTFYVNKILKSALVDSFIFTDENNDGIVKNIALNNYKEYYNSLTFDNNLPLSQSNIGIYFKLVFNLSKSIFDISKEHQI